MTVAELEERISNREFIEWAIFYGRRLQDQEIAMG
jgi:guanylate kinase